MRKMRLTVSYDGTNYHGFQVQPTGPTIQGELEKALSKVTGKQIRVIGSGRTDAGVHARGQVIHFETDSTIPPDRWPAALNVLLPDDIVVTEGKEVPPDFHARYDVAAKTYRFLIDNHRVKNVFLRNQAWFVPQPLDIERMAAAAGRLIGEHDFTSFSSAKTGVENRVRRIYHIDIDKEGRLIWFTFRGNGFLYNMVRIITGTLVEIGKGKREPGEMAEILAARDRTKAGKTAPPQGLYLWSVEYANTTQPIDS